MRKSSTEFGHEDLEDEDRFGGFDLGTALGSLATSAAQGAGVDPGIIQAAQTTLSNPAAKAALNVGVNVGLGAASKVIGGGGAPAAVHNDPAVQAAKAQVSPDAHAAFDQGVALAAAHTAGAATPGLTPAQQAANLIAAGAPKKISWLKLGVSAVGAGGIAFVLGAALPITIGAAVLAPAALHAFGKDTQ